MSVEEIAELKSEYERATKYYLNDADAKFIISSIQEGFVKYGYPVNDLEQTLKNIGDRSRRKH